jgi:hypothetical protein
VDSYVKDEVARRLNYREIENVEGIWTARLLEMTDLRRNSRTLLKLESVRYNLPLKEENFTVQALRREQ